MSTWVTWPAWGTPVALAVRNSRTAELSSPPGCPQFQPRTAIPPYSYPRRPCPNGAAFDARLPTTTHALCRDPCPAIHVPQSSAAVPSGGDQISAINHKPNASPCLSKRAESTLATWLTARFPVPGESGNNSGGWGVYRRPLPVHTWLG